MKTPVDMKNFRAADYIDAFQVITPAEARGAVLFLLLVLWAIAPVLQ